MAQIEKTLTLRVNSKTQIVATLKNSNSDQTQKLKLVQNNLQFKCSDIVVPQLRQNLKKKNYSMPTSLFVFLCYTPKLCPKLKRFGNIFHNK